MTAPPTIRVGVAGWSYADWAGIVYPKRPPAGFDPLVALGHLVDVIEINSTFYRTPTRKIVEAWNRRVSSVPQLEFSVKVPRVLTHGDAEAADTLAAFLDALEPLERGRGICAWLVQFPFTFRDAVASRSRLEAIVRELRRGHANRHVVCEFRHGSWFRAVARKWTRELGVQVASLDMPGSGPDGELVRLGFPGAPYVRWHGRNRGAWFQPGVGRDAKYDHLYGEEVVGRWIKHLERATTPGRVAYVIANNHFRGQAVVNAVQARALLRGERLPVPPQLLERYPALATRAVPTRDAPLPPRGLFDDLA